MGDKMKPLWIGKSLSWCLFHQVWADFCQNVVIQLLQSDLCALCQQNQMTVAKMRNLPEDRKLELIKNCQDHLVLVQKERQHYTTTTEVCRTQNWACIPFVHLQAKCT